MRLAAIALFCAGGGLARYGLSSWIEGHLSRPLPLGTFAVNVAGSFLIGLVMEAGLRGTLLPETLRIALTVGFLGGFTTFSTFSYETLKLLEGGQVALAALNACASVAACLLFTWLGMAAARAAF